MAIHALIPAAGNGSRVGGDRAKQYQEVAGRPMLAWSIAAFAAVPAVAGIHVVIAPDDAHFATLGLPARTLPVGAATRHVSVLNGLDVLAETLADEDWILVHDAARPGLSAALVRTLIDTLRNDPVGGLLALPLADTLKRERRGRSAATLERAGLWQAQTPQMFRFGLLRSALRSALTAGFSVTDEASAMEAAGHAPRLVSGSPRNFKVTYAEDLALADVILKDAS